jgi:hypothetical protein
MDKVRELPYFGNLKEGDIAFNGGSGAARIILKANGGIVLMTTDDNSPSGNAIFFKLDTNGLLIVTPWGTLRFDKTGFHVRAGAAKFDLMTLGGTAFSAMGGNGTVCMINAATIDLHGYCSLGIPTIPNTYYTAGMYPLPTPMPSGVVPVPLTPPISPFMFFSPTVKLAV